MNPRSFDWAGFMAGAILGLMFAIVPVLLVIRWPG